MSSLPFTLSGSLWLACLIVSAIGCLHVLLAAYLTRRFLTPSAGSRKNEPASVDPGHPGITILKPLCGAEPGLEDNIASVCVQDYPGRVQIILGVQSQSDPALGVVARLQTRFPDRVLDIVIDATDHGANAKVANLINMRPHARHDVLVLADSDMAVPQDYLSRLVAALAEPGVGAVTCLFRGVPTDGLWSRLGAMTINYHFLPGVIVGVVSRLAHPCFGSTIALSAKVLDEIGGFGRVRNHLADDYALGEAVRRQGYRVAIPPMILDHTCHEPSFGALLAHELRWARTVSIVAPAGFGGSVVTHPLPFALLAAAAQGFGPAGMSLVGVALACRLLLMHTMARLLDLQRADYWLGPVRDLLSFVIWVGALVPRRVQWRGRSFRVKPDGTLEPTVRGAPR